MCLNRLYKIFVETHKLLYLFKLIYKPQFKVKRLFGLTVKLLEKSLIYVYINCVGIYKKYTKKYFDVLPRNV